MNQENHYKKRGSQKKPITTDKLVLAQYTLNDLCDQLQNTVIKWTTPKEKPKKVTMLGEDASLEELERSDDIKWLEYARTAGRPRGWNCKGLPKF